MMMGSRTAVRILPSVGRLHEWIAIEEGYFPLERITPELLDYVMHQSSGHDSQPFRARPQDEPLVRNQVVVASGSVAGAIYYASTGVGRVVPDVHGVAEMSIYVTPESPVRSLEDLAGIPIGAGIFAGSHFATQRFLENRLPREAIVIEGMGGQLHRLTALLNREISVTALQDPATSIAQHLGMRRLATFEYKRLFWVHKDFDQHLLAGYFRVLKRAEAARAANPDTYRDLWARTLPADLLDDIEFSAFGLGERVVFEPISREEIVATLDWLGELDLDPPPSERAFEKLTVRVPV